MKIKLNVFHLKKKRLDGNRAANEKDRIIEADGKFERLKKWAWLFDNRGP